MQFSERWLRSMANPAIDTDGLSHLLTMSGLEVEELDPVAPPFTGIVVAQILSTEKHPDADKLKVCRVDAGQGEPLQIVCGAPNAEAGMKVPCALVGAVLPGDFRIKQAKLRGVPSSGMLCSARELGLSEDHAGLHVLPADAPIGQDIRSYLDLDDARITIKLTPNRADCLSLSGIAREVAALTGAPLNLPAIEPVPAAIGDRREIVLDAPEACPRYCGRIIRGVNAKAPTPDWMKQRIERCGVRSISALVDVTNFVMLELGQPLHAFDDARLSGAIHVRYPAAGEQLELLNEQVVEPTPDTLLIADEARALAMAGVMGGEQSGITLDTSDMFLESAFFAPDAIAGRARSYGFSSDASHRFERGVDFDLPAKAIERATALVLAICGGQAGPVVEAVAPEHLPRRPAVRLRPARARRLLGIELDDARIEAILRGLDLAVAHEGADLLVTPPSYRFDIEIEVDLVEELARVHGYDNIPTPPPRGSLAMLTHSESQRSSWALRHRLADRDYQEVINFAFVEAVWEADFAGNAEPIRLANPIASQLAVMRSTLLGGLVGNLITNRNRQQPRARVFEIGRCFRRDAGGAPVKGFDQPVLLAGLAAGPAVPEQWGVPTRHVDFFDVKADVEVLLAPRVARFAACRHPALHPGRCAEIIVEDAVIGVLGELHPTLVQKYDLGTAPVVFELRLDALTRAELPAYEPISRQPAVVRDLALIVDDSVRVEDLREAMAAAASEIVKSIELFDLYQGKGIGEGKKSLAFRVLMQDTRRTLEEAEVEAATSALTARAAEGFGARLRG
ncbi:MAG: phenylalanine--tRNA ligase subunit beta [Rhodocyclaceae bacterium]|nr:phenylalanine--tRNA ligase subunit beta [Rhodocyclaceae bacterium]